MPDLGRDFLMNPGDLLQMHMFDTPQRLPGHRRRSHDAHVGQDDRQRRQRLRLGAVRAERRALHGPAARLSTRCTARPRRATRNFNAAHTGNISFADEIGHFEYCAAVRNDAHRDLRQAARRRHQRSGQRRSGPAGDDVFCLPASASTLIKIGGCLNTDGDFDSVSYKFSWPGSISNPVADQLLNAQPVRFTSPLTHGQNFTVHGLRVQHQPQRVRRHGVRSRRRPASGTSPTPPTRTPASAA